MHKFKANIMALALIGVAAGNALAKDAIPAGNAGAGRVFAEHNCEACHVVATDQDIRPLIGDYAPGFAEIANRPATTPEALQGFLSRPHGYSNMPYPDLAPRDLANLVAYIISLRHHHVSETH
jgi:mono/diheme cytochrome c family protein